MRRVSTFLTLAAVLVLAGCNQPTGDGDDGTPTTPAEPGDVDPTVTIMEPTGDVQVATGQDITVRWSVEPEASGEHEIPHVGLHWGPDSVDAGPETGPGAYGNNEGVESDVTIPQQFTTTFSITEQGTYYLRAHAIADGSNHWSDTEIMIEVQASSDGGTQGTTETVEIGTQTSCSIANYAPSSITIQVGDSVQWENVDSCPHTATPAGMTGTGNIDSGETSDPIVFNTAGTYEISCDYHGQMSGEVVVEA